MKSTSRMAIILLGWLIFSALAWSSFPRQSTQAQTTRGQKVVSVKVGGTERSLYQGSFALVIGASAYASGTGWATLPGVERDLVQVRQTLEAQGFEVEVVKNPTRKQFFAALDLFIEQHGYESENRLVVYFAGHGYTGKAVDGREMGYVVPVDAPNPDRERSAFNRMAVSMNEMINFAERIQAKHALFLFDSCFSGSVFKLRGPVPDAIAEKATRPVRQFITSGTAGQAVPDQSEFCRAFVKGLTENKADLNGDGYVTGSELGSYLEDYVTGATRRAQTPQWGKILNPELNEGDFVFKTRSSGGGNPPQPGTSSEAPTRTNEALFWESIKNSSDVEDFREYLRKYPEGEFAGLARNRVAKLTPAPVPVKPVLTAGSRAQYGGMEFVYIPAGSFEMGSSESEWKEALRNCGSGCSEEWFSREAPKHRVTIREGFYLGRYEVTQGEWERIMGSNPSNFKGNPKLPVEKVSWEDAQAFIKKLNEREGREVYRLPREAEWEYACRAGTSGEYAGNLDGMGWYSGNAGGKTHAVGEKSPNGWGLYDMHGNVLEWCGDWYDSSYYQKSPSEDPRGPSEGSGRVIRGGSWDALAVFCRSALRDYCVPGYRFNFLGFRLLRMVDR